MARASTSIRLHLDDKFSAQSYPTPARVERFYKCTAIIILSRLPSRQRRTFRVNVNGSQNIFARTFIDPLRADHYQINWPLMVFVTRELGNHFLQTSTVLRSSARQNCAPSELARQHGKVNADRLQHSNRLLVASPIHL